MILKFTHGTEIFLNANPLRQVTAELISPPKSFAYGRQSIVGHLTVSKISNTDCVNAPPHRLRKQAVANRWNIIPENCNERWHAGTHTMPEMSHLSRILQPPPFCRSAPLLSLNRIIGAFSFGGTQGNETLVLVS